MPKIPGNIPRSGPPTGPEYDAFVRDDMEFRTITTLLHALESQEKVTLRDFAVTPKLKPYLKILSALSSLLVRNHEIVAILPKRSSRGLALLIGSDATPFNNNPRDDDEFVSGIEFIKRSIVTVGSSVDDYVVSNWKQSFEQHVQAFADLLNTAFKTPGTETTNALKRYSTIQSAPKIHRRITRSVVLGKLKDVDVTRHTTQTLGTLTNTERSKITVAMFRDKEGKQLHQELYDYFTGPARQFGQPSFVLCHQFFTCLLSQLSHEIKQLSTLRENDEPPVEFPVQLIRHVILHLDLLEYLAWESPFFAKYITTIPPGPESQDAISDSGIRPTSPISTEDDEHDEEDTGSDICTEFETGEDNQTSAGLQPPTPHPWILELRLITSNVHQLKHLLGRLPLPKPLSFSFDVIRYGKSSQGLKPWRELIHNLFPNYDEGEEILRYLERLSTNRNRKYKIFGAKGPTVIFKGAAHCEAVLGCLYNLARNQRPADSSWANIDRNVLRAAENSYGLLAPSKRCCPVCATIISYLQPETGTQLQAPSKHSIIFPCALPIGLPQQVRTRLLETYRTDLKNRLRIMVERGQSSDTSSSSQSEPLSDHGKNEQQSAGLPEKDDALQVMQDWEGMSMERVSAQWEEVKARLEGAVINACWNYMPNKYKLFLAPP